MKYIIIITFLLLFSYTLKAQEPDTTLQTELEKVYTELDTANLSTHFQNNCHGK